MINKQYRKKSLKENFLTKQQGEGLILKIIVRRKKTPFSEQRQSLTTENGLHHKKLLGFKEEQNIYTTNITTGYIDNLTRRIYYWIVHSSISFMPISKRGLIAACPSHHQTLDGDQLPTDSTSSSFAARTFQSTSSSTTSASLSSSSPLPLLRHQ
jgi:hypothetical protein